MKVKENRSFYYTASIMRGHTAVLRQGTLNAKDKQAALDRVYEMGRTVWKRTVLEVTLMNPSTGMVEATSKVGDGVRQHLLPYVKPEEEEEENKSGFVPWGQQSSYFTAGEFGTYFSPVTFCRLTGFEK